MSSVATIGDLLLALISSAGLSALLLLSLGFLFRNLIVTRLSRAVGHEYDTRIEQLRAQNGQIIEALREIRSERESARTLALSALGGHVSAVIDRRIAAIEVLWAAFCEIEKAVPYYVHLLEFISYDQKQIGPPLHKELMSADWIKTAEGRRAALQRVTEVRPFLGEKLYALFWTANAILGRATYRAISSYQEGSLRPWYDEEGIEALLEIVLEAEELAAFRSMQGDRLQWLTRQFEQRLMAEAAYVLSGGASAEDTLERAQRLIEATAAAIPLPAETVSREATRSGGS